MGPSESKAVGRVVTRPGSGEIGGGIGPSEKGVWPRARSCSAGERRRHSGRSPKVAPNKKAGFLRVG